MTKDELQTRLKQGWKIKHNWSPFGTQFWIYKDKQVCRIRRTQIKKGEIIK